MSRTEENGSDTFLRPLANARQEARIRQANFVINLGLSANIFLSILKISTGILFGSRALFADGVNSCSDVVYLIFVKILLKFSGKPADKEHPYGHQQFESIAAVVIGAFVVCTGLALFWDSISFIIEILRTGNNPDASPKPLALLVAVFTICSKFALMLNASLAGKRTGNVALLALAKDHRNDIFASIGVLVGVGMGLFGFHWVDPLAAALVAAIVAKTGIDILRESSAELMDTLPDNGMESKIRELAKKIPGVREIEDVHIHRFGPYYMVNLTIGVDGGISVAEGDRIADSLEALLYEELELLRRAYIHYHPASCNAEYNSSEWKI